MACDGNRYNTGNPICSNDLRDLNDDTIIIDGYVNSEEDTVKDRFGIDRLTLAGIKNKADTAIVDFTGDAQTAIDGFEQLIDDKIIAQGGVEIANEWGDPPSPDKVLSQEFLSESNNSVNIFDFGAKFDGETNDTDFWVEAIQYCKSKGKKLLLPKGVSIVDPDVIDPLGVSIEGIQGGYFNRNGSIIQSTSKTGNIFTQKNTGTSNITFSWKNILFRNCHNAWQVGYVVNCKFTNLFIEDATGTFEFGMSDVLGTLWNKFLNCQTNTSGRGINITGKDMANSNTFVNCAFRGGESSYLGAVSGYGAIGNTFISTEFFSKGRAVGITLGKTYNTTFINPYFESRDHSIRITNQTRGLKLINPTFAVYEGDGNLNPCYIHHSSGVLDLSIDGGTVFAVDKEVNKGLSLFHTDKPESLRGVDFTNTPVVNVSGGTVTSIGYSNLSNVGINRVSGNIRMNKVISGSFISNDMTLSYGGKSLSVSFRAAVTNLSIDEVRIPFVDEFYNAAHSVLGTGILRSKNKDSIVTFRLSSGKSSLYMYTQDGRVIQWSDLDVGDYITGEVNFAVY